MNRRDDSTVQEEKKSDTTLTPEEVEWVVNDIGELGVRIRGVSYFLYKGESLVYGSEPDEGSPMMVRPVQKREFGEVCHPVGFKPLSKLEDRYTEGDRWGLL